MVSCVWVIVPLVFSKPCGCSLPTYLPLCPDIYCCWLLGLTHSYRVCHALHTHVCIAAVRKGGSYNLRAVKLLVAFCAGQLHTEEAGGGQGKDVS